MGVAKTNIIPYHLKSLPGAEGKGMLLHSGKRVFHYSHGKAWWEKGLSNIFFYYPTFGEHFVRKSPSLSKFLLLVCYC